MQKHAPKRLEVGYQYGCMTPFFAGSRWWGGIPGGRLQLVLMRHPPPAICQNLRGGGGELGGGVGRRVGGGGVLAAWLGGLRATHYYHMHTSRGCLGAWGYGGTYAIIAISCLCREDSLKALEDQRHSTPFN